MTERHRTALAGTANDLRAKAANARASYHRVVNLPTVDERLYREMALEADAVGRAAEYEQRVTRALRVGVGYDVYQGKPITKAVFTGTIALGASEGAHVLAAGGIRLGIRFAAGRLITMGAAGVLATSTAPDAIAVGAAIVAGGAASVAADWSYDQMFPTQEEKIRDGKLVIKDDPPGGHHPSTPRDGPT